MTWVSATRFSALQSIRGLLPMIAIVAGVSLLTPGSGSDDVRDDSPGVEADEVSENRYEYRAQHDPNGIGKFYLGREIAHVMGVAGIPWLERPQREKEESLTLLIDSLDLQAGSQVADIGAGSGVISFLMADKVGRTGKVWAVDIQPEMLAAIQKKKDERNIEQIEPLLCGAKETKLPSESIDTAIFVDVYHELEYPYEVLLDLSGKIKPGGRVILVEYRKEDPEVPIKRVHKMSIAQVRKELEIPELKLKWKEAIETLPWQHILVFEKQK